MSPRKTRLECTDDQAGECCRTSILPHRDTQRLARIFRSRVHISLQPSFLHSLVEEIVGCKTMSKNASNTAPEESLSKQERKRVRRLGMG